MVAPLPSASLSLPHLAPVVFLRLVNYFLAIINKTANMSLSRSLSRYSSPGTKAFQIPSILHINISDSKIKGPLSFSKINYSAGCFHVNDQLSIIGKSLFIRDSSLLFP